MICLANSYWKKGRIVVLLPFYRKLLKMHEAKYEPMDKVRAKIEIDMTRCMVI